MDSVESIARLYRIRYMKNLEIKYRDTMQVSAASRISLSVPQMRAFVSSMVAVQGPLRPVFTDLAKELSAETIDEPATQNLSERIAAQINPENLLTHLQYLLVYCLFLRTQGASGSFPKLTVQLAEPREVNHTLAEASSIVLGGQTEELLSGPIPKENLEKLTLKYPSEYVAKENEKMQGRLSLLFAYVLGVELANQEIVNYCREALKKLPMKRNAYLERKEIEALSAYAQADQDLRRYCAIELTLLMLTKSTKGLQAIQAMLGNAEITEVLPKSSREAFWLPDVTLKKGVQEIQEAKQSLRDLPGVNALLKEFEANKKSAAFIQGLPKSVAALYFYSYLAGDHQLQEATETEFGKGFDEARKELFESFSSHILNQIWEAASRSEDNHLKYLLMTICWHLAYCRAGSFCLTELNSDLLKHASIPVFINTDETTTLVLTNKTKFNDCWYPFLKSRPLHHLVVCAHARSTSFGDARVTEEMSPETASYLQLLLTDHEEISRLEIHGLIMGITTEAIMRPLMIERPSLQVVQENATVHGKPPLFTIKEVPHLFDLILNPELVQGMIGSRLFDFYRYSCFVKNQELQALCRSVLAQVMRQKEDFPDVTASHLRILWQQAVDLRDPIMKIICLKLFANRRALEQFKMEEVPQELHPYLNFASKLHFMNGLSHLACDIEDLEQDLLQLCRKFEIQSFTFGLIDTQKNLDPVACKILANYLPTFKDARRLRIRGYCLKGESVEQLMDAMKMMPKLEKVRWRVKMDPQGQDHFVKGIGELPRKLEIHFLENELRPQLLARLAQYRSNFGNIK